MPAIGVRAGGRGAATVRPAHLRVDLDLADDAAAAATLARRRAGSGGRARRSSWRCTCRPIADAAARALARLDLAGLDVARVLAFTIGHDTTQPATLDAVRAWRARQAGMRPSPIATGTPSDLARIHLAPAPLVAARRGVLGDGSAGARHRPDDHRRDRRTAPAIRCAR